MLIPKNRIWQNSIVCIVAILANGCSRSPYFASNKFYLQKAKSYARILKKTPVALDSIPMASLWVGTTNFNMRKPNFVIIHHTAQNSCEQTLRTFTQPSTQVSAHYVICKDGTIHQMLNDYLRAWHAGVSKWGNVTDVNSASIGIEIDNNGFENFTQEQINSLLLLLSTLKKKYTILQPNFIGHADIAPIRKNDPNITFPWKLLAEKGFGLWQDSTLPNLPIGNTFNPILALRIIGYDTKDSIAAIRAFKRHFMQDSSSTTLNQVDKQVLLSLSTKY